MGEDWGEEPILCKIRNWDILTRSLIGARTLITSEVPLSACSWNGGMPAGPGESEVARQDASETIRVRRLIKEVGRHLTHVAIAQVGSLQQCVR